MQFGRWGLSATLGTVGAALTWLTGAARHASAHAAITGRVTAQATG